MKSTVSKTVAVILMFIVAIEFFGYYNIVKKQTPIIAELKSSLEEAEAKYEVQEIELNEYKEKYKDRQTYAEEREKDGLKLIEKLPQIKSLAELIDAWQPRMDGAVSEGYGHRLAVLTKKEGLKKLIKILSDKNESIIKDAAYLLFGEYVITGQSEEIDSAIKELQAMDLDSMDNKQRGIVLNLLSEAYFAESRINGI